MSKEDKEILLGSFYLGILGLPTVFAVTYIIALVMDILHG